MDGKVYLVCLVFHVLGDVSGYGELGDVDFYRKGHSAEGIEKSSHWGIESLGYWVNDRWQSAEGMEHSDKKRV